MSWVTFIFLLLIAMWSEKTKEFAFKIQCKENILHGVKIALNAI